jgi:hypothetical protein
MSVGLKTLALILISHAIRLDGMPVKEPLSKTTTSDLAIRIDASTSTNLVGWTAQANARGTIDIIWSCASTMILCSWTALCLNVPPSHWKTRRRVWQKVMMACLCVLGPEFIFQLALGQWESARRSVKTFKQSGYQRWTLKHAFFADMGGFILHSDDWVPFPVNAKQLHYLVTEGYIPFSAVNLDPETIEDKNKGDMFARCIAITQILWFTVNYFTRWHQRLAVTTLELTTLGFIFCTLGTYFCWASKPKDVIRPIILRPSESLRKILQRAGDNAKYPYKNTPLDFVGCDQWSWTLYWKYWLNVLDRLHIVLSSKQRPLIKIPDDNFPPPSSTTVPFLCVIQLGYAAIPLLGWKDIFPTSIESFLWKVSTLVVLGSVLLAWFVEIVAWRIPAALPRTQQKLKDRTGHFDAIPLASKSTKRGVLDWLRNNTPENDPNSDVPISALFPVTLAGASYCLVRGYMLVDDFVNLRAQPPSVYEMVQWDIYWPHF